MTLRYNERSYFVLILYFFVRVKTGAKRQSKKFERLDWPRVDIEIMIWALLMYYEILIHRKTK
jgi:hypothetical protein